jgi:hypothetical protein
MEIQLLEFMATVADWVKSNDPRAQPFLDADAVRRINGGGVSFHKDRFLKLAAEYLEPPQTF